MKSLVLLLITLGASTMFGMTLTASCESGNGRNRIAITAELENIYKAAKLTSVVVEGQTHTSVKDVSQLPLIKNDTLTLDIQFGRPMYNSATFSLQSCQDSFRSGGTATYKTYVGGFAGTSQSPSLTCTCSLK